MRQHKVRNLKFVWALGLVLLALFPTLVAVAQSNDDIIALPYIRNTYVQTQGCHPDGWGTDCAVDLAGGKGTPLYAPISGEVTFMIDDGYGNPTLFIENGRWKVIMLHAEFSIQSGQVNIGTQIGVESNMGYTKGAGGRFCGTGSNCGYHLHFDVYDKANRKWVNPLKVALPFDNDGVVQHLVSTVEDETQYFATSDSINWDEVGFSGTIITSSGENIVIQPTAAAPQPEPTAVAVQQQPETITVQLPNPKNPQTAQFILSWVMLMGLLVASGMLAFGGSSQTRVMGIILLIALILVGFWLYNQGFTTAFKPPSTVALAAVNPQPEPTPELQPAPTAEIVTYVTNVEIEIHQGWQNQSHINPAPPPADGILGGFPDRTVYANPSKNAKPITIFVSHYVPLWDGEFHNGDGPNCGRYSMGPLPDYADNYPNAEKRFGWCWSRMSSGKMWEEYMGYAVACPSELPFGTKIYAFEREWECLDRGGLIYKEGSVYRIDFLTPNSPAPFASQHSAYMVLP